MLGTLTNKVLRRLSSLVFHTLEGLLSLRRPLKMTFYLPLDAASPFPQSPAFLLPSPQRDYQLNKLIKAVMKAKRIVVVCGMICAS